VKGIEIPSSDSEISSKEEDEKSSSEDSCIEVTD